MTTQLRFLKVLLSIFISCEAFLSLHHQPDPRIGAVSSTRLFNWFDNLLSPGSSSPSAAPSAREREFPEQYPATYELLKSSPWELGDEGTVRPLLKNTQLEGRRLRVAYDANWQGYNARAFHRAVDGRGAAVVLCRAKGKVFGGYNPKGWSSNGGARPSVAAFLFYKGKGGWKKLRKIGGGGLACAKDDPDTGIWLGPDGLVIPFAPQSKRQCSSFLGTYFERGREDDEDLYSIVPGGSARLNDLKVLVGVYDKDEEIPYSGAVLDFTSG